MIRSMPWRGAFGGQGGPQVRGRGAANFGGLCGLGFRMWQVRSGALGARSVTLTPALGTLYGMALFERARFDTQIVVMQVSKKLAPLNLS